MTMSRLHLGGPSSRRRFELYFCLLGVHFCAADGRVSIYFSVSTYLFTAVAVRQKPPIMDLFWCLFVCFKAESHCVALTSLGILPPSECSDCRHMPPRPVLYVLFLSPSFHVCLPQCLVYNQPTLSSCVDFFFLHKQLPQILDFTTEIFY